jgi:hypothetical protein
MVCLHAMGAYKINIVQAITKEMSLDEDYIMVEDRGNPSIPKRVMEHGRVCNVPWLKQCLVSGSSDTFLLTHCATRTGSERGQ